MDEIFSRVSAQYVLHQKTSAHACMHITHDVRSCEYMQPPWAFTRTWATTGVKRVDTLYLGAYTEGGRYSGLLQYSVLAQEKDSLETLLEYLLR